MRVDGRGGCVISDAKVELSSKNHENKKLRKVRERYRSHVTPFQLSTNFPLFIADFSWDHSIAIMFAFVPDDMKLHLMQLVLLAIGAWPQGWPLRATFNATNFAEDMILVYLLPINALWPEEPPAAFPLLGHLVHLGLPPLAIPWFPCQQSWALARGTWS